MLNIKYDVHIYRFYRLFIEIGNIIQLQCYVLFITVSAQFFS